ncbi:MAG: hypothetical protein Q8R29_01510 [bacterium]|nr:hypothetical protein [bacterium]
MKAEKGEKMANTDGRMSVRVRLSEIMELVMSVPMFSDIYTVDLRLTREQIEKLQERNIWYANLVERDS